MGQRPPFETFKGATCKGCLALGTACGTCEKCLWEREQMFKVDTVQRTKHWLTYSDLIVAFTAGVIRSHRWIPPRHTLVMNFAARVNLFVLHIQNIWPPAISEQAGLIEVDLQHFRHFVRHFLTSICPDWGVPGGLNADLDGIVLSTMQELRRCINEVEEDRLEAGHA